jgi:hypothetical protein
MDGERHAGTQACAGVVQALEEAISLRVRLVPLSRLDQGQQAAGVLERQNRRLPDHVAYASQ